MGAVASAALGEGLTSLFVRDRMTSFAADRAAAAARKLAALDISDREWDADKVPSHRDRAPAPPSNVWVPPHRRAAATAAAPSAAALGRCPPQVVAPSLCCSQAWCRASDLAGERRAYRRCVVARPAAGLSPGKHRGVSLSRRPRAAAPPPRPSRSRAGLAAESPAGTRTRRSPRRSRCCGASAKAPCSPPERRQPGRAVSGRKPYHAT